MSVACRCWCEARVAGAAGCGRLKVVSWVCGCVACGVLCSVCTHSKPLHTDTRTSTHTNDTPNADISRPHAPYISRPHAPYISRPTLDGLRIEHGREHAATTVYVLRHCLLGLELDFNVVGDPAARFGGGRGCGSVLIHTSPGAPHTSYDTYERPVCGFQTCALS